MRRERAVQSNPATINPRENYLIANIFDSEQIPYVMVLNHGVPRHMTAHIFHGQWSLYGRVFRTSALSTLFTFPVEFYLVEPKTSVRDTFFRMDLLKVYLVYLFLTMQRAL